MIGGYSDHAANERTYLAWVRTGIAITAFGFVIEKFNLFILTLASTAVADQSQRLQLAALAGRVGRYDGLALIAGGVVLVVLATVRFIRITRFLDDGEPHAAADVRTELTLSAVLVLLIAGYGVYLAVG